MFEFLRDLCPCLFKEEKPLPARPLRDLINYRLNDPNTPNLAVSLPVPQQPNVMQFTVKGFDKNNVGAGPSTEAGQAANVYATLVRSLDNILKYRKLTKWPGTKNLLILPRAGQDLNAYYDRRHLKFFWQADVKARNVVFTCESVDIVAHELGHALLDTMRPDLWSAQSLEIWSFHEAFGDINAIATVMLHDHMLEYALKETKGNLMKHNVISRLAEEMGDAIYHLTGGKGGYKPGALRNSINNFTYTKPEGLPKRTTNDKLAAECHSFGRLFVAAWYEIMIGIYEQNKKEGQGRMKALRSARDYAYQNVVEALRVAPRSPRFYDAVARAMLSVDRLKGGNYQGVMKRVFQKRKMLLKSRRMAALETASWQEVSKSLEREDEVIKTGEGFAVRKAVASTTKISDSIGMLSTNVNPLFNLEIELADDTFYDMDSDGRTLMALNVDNSEAMESAVVALNYLNETNAVGESWEVQDNKLVRKHVQCRCGCGS
tara:strand:+ start:1325 stop:2791 length:1467 start_codon:yes stop_codon:yes gene_type:complete